VRRRNQHRQRFYDPLKSFFLCVSSFFGPAIGEPTAIINATTINTTTINPAANSNHDK